MSKKRKGGAEWGKGATSMSRGEMAVALVNKGMLEDMSLGLGAMGTGAWGMLLLQAMVLWRYTCSAHMPTRHFLNAKPLAHTIQKYN